MRLGLCYLAITIMLLCGLTLYAHELYGQPRTKVIYRSGLTPITNSSGPDEVMAHFSGHPLRVYGQSDLGLPVDGYCQDRSNGVSWRIEVCWGTQPESQP